MQTIKDKRIQELEQALVIEAALEKVRAASMAMHHSKELRTVVKVTFEQLIKLELKVEICLFDIFKEDSNDMHVWAASPQQLYDQVFHIPYFNHLLFKKHKAAKNKAPSFFSYTLNKSQKKSWLNHLLNKTEIGQRIKKGRRKIVLKADVINGSLAVHKHHSLMVYKFEEHPYSERENEIILRISQVFEQAYIRFLDLQKAETQAREAQIEAALERVRASTMAMHHSSDLTQSAAVLFEQIQLLGAKVYTSGFVLCEQGNPIDIQWMSAGNGQELIQHYIPHEEEPHHFNMYKAWQAGETLLTQKMEGEALQAALAFLMAQPSVQKNLNKIVDTDSPFPTLQILHAAYFSKGYLLIITTEEYPEKDIFIRFAKVFEQTYTRFLDLQRAETQAREAQIEAALERVRARTMWMQRGHELREVVSVMYDEMELLGLAKWGCNIMICHKDKEVFEFWLAEETDSNQIRNYFVKGKEHPVYRNIWMNWENQTNSFTLHHKDEYKLAFDNYWLEETDFKHLPDEVKANVFNRNEVFLHYTPMKHGLLNAISYEKISDKLLAVLARFAKVFEQTYTRFLDLQKAEGQAREAQIEAALEKIRNRTLLMRDSSELNEAVAIFFQQFKSLGLLPEEARAFFGHIDEEKSVIQAWMTRMDGTVMSGSHFTPLNTPPMVNFYEAWKNQTPILIRNYEGVALDNYLKFVSSLPHVKKDKDYQQLFRSNPERVIMTDAFFLQGSINIMTFEPLSQEAQDMLVRFAKVFEFTYTRFLDLQKAEEQAREAQIETALERVRARTMAMHKSEELAKVVKLLYEQLALFGMMDGQSDIEIYLIEEETGIATAWATDLNFNGMIENYQLPLEKFPAMKGEFQQWVNTPIGERKNLLITNTSRGDEWEAVLQYFESLPKVRDFAVAFREANIQQWTTHHAYFSHGFLAFQAETPTTKENLDILQRFSKVFEQTYTRFLDLQQAEERAKEAKIEAALERVRARAMAMRHSDELSEAAELLYQEFFKLGVEPFSCGYLINDDEKGEWKIWLTNPGEPFFKEYWTIPYTADHNLQARYESWKNQEAFHCAVLEGAANLAHHQVICQYAPWKEEVTDDLAPQLAFNSAHFSLGHLLVIAPDRLSTELEQAIVRFANVFDLTYRRFLDLEKAEEQNRQLEKTFEENQRLLHSILPEQIAEQIRAGQQTIVKRFEQVSILFADIVGFTILSEKITPKEVVDILNGLFSKFDDLTDKYGLEKIKTIGDAYMVASGVPEEKAKHAHRIFQFAQDMLQAIQDFNQVVGTDLKIRIGISSGPVVAGVIGKKKFAYDLWGDSVNTAARMEAYGQASCIQVAPPTYELLKNEFKFEKISNVEIKGKGEMDVYMWSA